MRVSLYIPIAFGVACALACGGGSGGAAAGKGAGRGAAAVPVRIAPATRVDAPITIFASGVVDPMQTVAVTAQASGALLTVAFREGQYVQKGDVLFRIDPRSLRAAVDQATAALARDRAQAAAAERNDVRYQTLVKEDYVAREEADQIHATAVAAAAVVAADQAALRAAQVNLGYATIRAPIAGRTGGLLTRVGNIVGPSSGPLVVINQIQPILVRFPVLSQDLPLLLSAVARHPLPVRATKADSGNATEVGTLSFLDNSVDSLTGTATGKAVVQNRAGHFWPGQLVSLGVDVGVQHGVLTVPNTAVLEGQQGSYVYVVDQQKQTVQTRNITTDRIVGLVTIVASGLREGEQVVTDGQSRLSPGSKISIVAPSRDTAQAATLGVANGAPTGNAGGEVAPGFVNGTTGGPGGGNGTAANGTTGALAGSGTTGGRGGTGAPGGTGVANGAGGAGMQGIAPTSGATNSTTNGAANAATAAAANAATNAAQVRGGTPAVVPVTPNGAAAPPAGTGPTGTRAPTTTGTRPPTTTGRPPTGGSQP